MDERGVVLRASSHPERACVVVSIWHGDTCVASFRLPLVDTARFAAFLREPLEEWLAAGAPPPSTAPGSETG